MNPANLLQAQLFSRSTWIYKCLLWAVMEKSLSQCYITTTVSLLSCLFFWLRRRYFEECWCWNNTGPHLKKNRHLSKYFFHIIKEDIQMWNDMRGLNDDLNVHFCMTYPFNIHILINNICITFVYICLTGSNTKGS